MKEENRKIAYEAGKKAQEILDMNILGAIITKSGGKVVLSDIELLSEYYVSRIDLPQGGIEFVAEKD